MKDPVLCSLSRKRADIAGQINRLEAQVRQLTADLEAVDATIRVFDPTADIGAIKARVYPPRSKASRHQMTRWVLSALHAANGPMSGTDVQTFVMKARDLNPNDARLVASIRKRVSSCLGYQRRKGKVLAIGTEGKAKLWALVGGRGP